MTTIRKFKTSTIKDIITTRFDEIAIASDKRTIKELEYLKRKVHRILGSYGFISRFFYRVTYDEISHFGFALDNLKFCTIPSSKRREEKLEFLRGFLKVHYRLSEFTYFTTKEYLLQELMLLDFSEKAIRLSNLYRFVTTKSGTDDFVQLSVGDYVFITTEIKSE